MNTDALKYPVGKFQEPVEVNPEMIRGWINTIEKFPAKVVKEVGPLTPEQQGWIYRPEGWTIKQVIHHCADSHMNAFIRMKLALTEDRPSIKPYLEAEWAKQIDYEIPVIHSIKMLEGLHHRWAILLKNLDEQQFNRSFLHPENGNEWNLAFTAAMYAWHCDHHLAHIIQAKRYQGKFEG